LLFYFTGTYTLFSGAGTIFGQGGQNRERQIDEVFIEFAFLSQE